MKHPSYSAATTPTHQPKKRMETPEPQSVATAQEKERMLAEYEQKMAEYTGQLKAIFYFWLLLMLYITVDSRGEHVLGFLVFSALIAAVVAAGMRVVEWIEDEV